MHSGVEGKMEVAYSNWWEVGGGGKTASQDVKWPVGGMEGVLSGIRSGGRFGRR